MILRLLRRRGIELGFVIYAACLECSASPPSKGHKMPTSNRLTAIVEDSRPICVGRFIIDVPKTANIIYGPARLPVEIVRAEGEAINLDEFVRKAVERSAEDKWLARDELVGERSLLGKVIDGVGADHKIVFGVGRGDSSSYNVQSFIRSGNDLFIQQYVAFGEGDRYLKAVQDAKEIASHLRHRAANEFPGDSGFCIEGAFISDPQTYMVEEVTLGIRLKEFDGIHISIGMTKKSKLVESDAIEPRLKAAERNAVAQGQGDWYHRILFLRKGRRKIGAWDGFEVAAHMPRQKVAEESHEFAFLSHGEPKNPLIPVLDVQLHTGISDNMIGGIKPTITDEEALYLWDKVLSSIRPRPVPNSATK